jgi:roadblock/LC7 domain-containing protein
VDGKEEKPYDIIAESSLAFSPDSSRVAYLARAGEHWVAVVDGKEGKPCDDARGLIFSPDSLHVAYVANIEGKGVLLVDGKKLASYDGISSHTIGDMNVLYSPDGKSMAYGAQINDKWTVVINGKHGKFYDAIGALVFSPDGQQVAYAAKTDDKWAAVAKAQEGKSYDAIGRLAFSPDGRRLVYLADSGEKTVLVVDGVEGKAYASIVEADAIKQVHGCQDDVCWDAFYLDKPFQFSPDSQRVAYVAKVGEKRINVSEKWSAVVDGKEQSPYDGIGGLIFSPDSRHVAYVAGAGARQFVVVDGNEGKQYDGLVKGTKCVFDSANELHYLAKQNTSSDGKSYDIVLVEQTIQ